MSRKFTRSQTLENRGFLKLLRRLGNIRLACRELGLCYGTMQERRKRHPSFAARWAAALAAAQGRLGQVGVVGPAAGRPRCSPLRAGTYKVKKKGGPSTTACGLRSGRTGKVPHPNPSPEGDGRFRTLGGEMVIVRTRGGKFQMRRAQPGTLTREAEQHFLATLGTTCNVKLAAASTGAAAGAFSRRRRRRPGFAEAMREAIAEGYDQLEAELIRSAIELLRGGGAAGDAAGPAVTGMTAQVALSLLGHHRKTARLPEQYQPYVVSEVHERLERKMRLLGMLDRPDSSGAGEGVV